jgi:GTP1/Obg family GTP-binding protein
MFPVVYSPAKLFVWQGYTIYMNRYPFITAVFCAFVISGSFASAQTTTPTTTDTTTVAPETPTRRPFTAEPTLQRIAQTRLVNLAANMSNRMDSAVARLQNVTDRLNSRLTKMSSEGIDVTAATAELSLAQTKLDEAKRNLANIDTEVNAFVGSATPRENWQNLKNTYLGTRAAIVAAHQNILATINLAKNSTAAPLPTASTTTVTTTNN